jgi:16S rRNA (cytosine967-C5)-methyltransferase
MPRVETARDVARLVLRRVEQSEAYASLALSGELQRLALAAADRGLATELVYGVLRHRTRLDRALSAYAPRGLGKLSLPVLVALRIAAYQLLFLRVPAHAAVDDAVGAVSAVDSQVGKFANAVLRKLAAEGEPPLPPASDRYAFLESAHSIPRWLTDVLKAAVVDEEVVALAEALGRAPPVTLRAALWRTTREELAAQIRAVRPQAELVPSPHLPESLDVRGASSPESLEPFQAGLCTVQDQAATLVGRLLSIAPGEQVLDACAGVGGKATHLAELAKAHGGEAKIDAADLSVRKLDLLGDAMRRLGLCGIRPVACDLTSPSAPLLASYDRVLLDAPCSGLGVLARHPEGKWRRRPAEIPKLAALQAQLLDALAPRVRPGGILVYSVCTFTEEEGPAQVARFLAAHADFAVALPEPQAGVDFGPFLCARGFFRAFPHRHGTDGFFAARMVRTGSA